MSEKLYDEFMSTKQDKSDNTIRSYKETLEDFICSLKITNYDDLNKITAKQIRNYLSDLLMVKDGSPTGIGFSSANTKLTIIKVFINWCNENYKTSNHEADLVKKYKVPKVIPVFLSEEERNMMIKKSEELDLKLMIVFMFYTGIRCEESTKIKLSDIRNCRVLVHGKGNKERELFLNEYVCNLLNEYLKTRKGNSEYLFVSRRGQHGITPDAVYKRVKKIALSCGIEEERAKKIGAHTTRRTFAGLLSENNVSSFNIQKALGHENIATTQLYVRGAGNKGVDEALMGQSVPEN